MGWLFQRECSRADLIAERTKNWERTYDDGLHVATRCLAHCYRGGVFSGVFWTVWERTFTRCGQPERPSERWIGCDVLQHRKDYGWGYKDMEESMGPYYYSCPLKYLDLVPVDQFGGHADWREGVKLHHARSLERRRAKRATQACR